MQVKLAPGVCERRWNLFDKKCTICICDGKQF